MGDHPSHSSSEVERLRARVAQLESFIAARGIILPAPPELPDAVSALPPPLPESLANSNPVSVSAPSPAPEPPKLDAVETARPSNMERFVGTRIAAFVGAIAVLGALVFFIKLAIELGLFGKIGPQPKFVAALVVSALLLALAEWARKRWTIEASIGLYAAGIASLFVTIAGGVFVLELLGPITGALLALACTLVGAAAAARSRSLLVGIVGLIGGFALPLSTGVLQLPGLQGALFLSAIAAIALAMTAFGPPSFAWLRAGAVLALAPLGCLWAACSHCDALTICTIALVWWIAFMASALLETRRERFPLSNAGLIVGVSAVIAAASLGAVTDAGPARALGDPFNVLPVVVLVCLAALWWNVRRSERPAFGALLRPVECAMLWQAAALMAVPCFDGALGSAGLAGGWFISGALLVTLTLSWFLSRSFAYMRLVAVFAVCAMGAAWVLLAEPSNLQVGVFALAWSIAIAAVAIKDAARGGSDGANSATVVASVLAIAGLAEALLLRHSWSLATEEPTAYLPLVALVLLGAWVAHGRLAEQQRELPDSLRRVLKTSEQLLPVLLLFILLVFAGNGVFSAHDLTGGIFLSAFLALALILTSAGPPHFAWLRVVTIGVLLVFGGYWAIGTDQSGGTITLVAVAWWGALTASSLIEAMRGRSGNWNAVTLIVSSLLASLVALAAIDSLNPFEDPQAYLPFAIAGGLGFIILQYHNSGRETEELVPGPELATASALQLLSDSSIAIIPATALVAMGVFLPSGGLAVGAAACASIMVISRKRLGNAIALPIAILAMILAPLAALYTLIMVVVNGTYAFYWPPSDVTGSTNWRWDPNGSVSSTWMLLSIRVAWEQVGPLLAAALLFLPLIREKASSAIAHLCATAGLIVLLVLLVSLCHFWSGALVVSLAVCVAVASGCRSPHWLAYTLLLTAVAALEWILGDVMFLFGPSYGSLTSAVTVAAAVCTCVWTQRFMVHQTSRPNFDAAAALLGVAACTMAVLIDDTKDSMLYAEGTAAQQTMALLLCTTSVGAVIVGAIARARPSTQLLVVPFLLLTIPIVLVVSSGGLLVFGIRLSQSFVGGGPLLLATAAPFAALICVVRLERTSLQKLRLWPAHSAFVSEVCLIVGLSTCVVVSGALAGGTPPAELVIGSLAVCGAGAIFWGFKKGRAGFRWMGLAILGLLAVRLLVVDLRETSAVFKVAGLFVTGLVLVGTSIAYTLILAPRKPK